MADQRETMGDVGSVPVTIERAFTDEGSQQLIAQMAVPTETLWRYYLLVPCPLMTTNHEEGNF